jgi:hypothetical protein
MTARCFSCIRTGPIGAHPLLGLVPETPPRGAGRSSTSSGSTRTPPPRGPKAAGHMVIEPPADKPHGLRECTVLSPEGYAFSPPLHAG